MQTMHIWALIHRRMVNYNNNHRCITRALMAYNDDYGNGDGDGKVNHQYVHIYIIYFWLAMLFA